MPKVVLFIYGSHPNIGNGKMSVAQSHLTTDLEMSGLRLPAQGGRNL